MLTALKNALSAAWSFTTKTIPAALAYPFQKPKEFIICKAIPLSVSTNKVISVIGMSMFNIEKFLNWYHRDNEEPPLGFNDYTATAFTIAYLLLLTGDLIITANRGPGTFRHYDKKYQRASSNQITPWAELKNDFIKLKDSRPQYLAILFKSTLYLLKFIKNSIVPSPKSELGYTMSAFYYALTSLGYISSGFAAQVNYFGVNNFINFSAKKLFAIDPDNVSTAFVYFREIYSGFTGVTSYLSAMATTQPSQIENSHALCRSIQDGEFKILGHSYYTYFKISMFIIGNVPIFFLSRLTTEHVLENSKNVPWIKWLNDNAYIHLINLDKYKDIISDFSGFSATSSFILSALIESMKKKEEIYFDDKLWYEDFYRKSIYTGSFLIILENFISNFSGIANTLEKNYHINTHQPGWIFTISFSTFMYIVQVYNFYCKKIMEDNLKHWHKEQGHVPRDYDNYFRLVNADEDRVTKCCDIVVENDPANNLSIFADECLDNLNEDTSQIIDPCVNNSKHDFRLFSYTGPRINVERRIEIEFNPSLG